MARYIFAASGSGTGVELWKSGGTAATTVLVKDIDGYFTGVYPQDLRNVGSTLYFTANVSGLGRELYKSDGTNAGTVLVKDINAGGYGSDPSSLLAASGKLFFVASDPARLAKFGYPTVRRPHGNHQRYQCFQR